MGFSGIHPWMTFVSFWNSLQRQVGVLSINILLEPLGFLHEPCSLWISMAHMRLSHAPVHTRDIDDHDLARHRHSVQNQNNSIANQQKRGSRVRRRRLRDHGQKCSDQSERFAGGPIMFLVATPAMMG